MALGADRNQILLDYVAESGESGNIEERIAQAAALAAMFVKVTRDYHLSGDTQVQGIMESATG